MLVQPESHVTLRKWTKFERDVSLEILVITLLPLKKHESLYRTKTIIIVMEVSRLWCSGVDLQVFSTYLLTFRRNLLPTF